MLRAFRRALFWTSVLLFGLCCAAWGLSYWWSVFFQVKPIAAGTIRPSVTWRASKGTFSAEYYHYSFAPEDAEAWDQRLATYPRLTLRTHRMHNPIQFDYDDRKTKLWQWRGYGIGRERETMRGGTSPGSAPAPATGLRLGLIAPFPLAAALLGMPAGIALWHGHRSRRTRGFPITPVASAAAPAPAEDLAAHPSDSDRPK